MGIGMEISHSQSSAKAKAISTGVSAPINQTQWGCFLRSVLLRNSDLDRGRDREGEEEGETISG